MAFDSRDFCLSVSSEGEENSNFCGIGKNRGRYPLVVKNWNNDDDHTTRHKACLGQPHFQSVYFF